MNLNFVMALSLMPTGIIVFIIMYVLGLNSRRFLFGVRADSEFRKSEAALKAIKDYKKQMWIMFAVSMVLTIPPFFLKGASLPYAYWMFWFCLMLVAASVPFGRQNAKLKEAKRELYGEKNKESNEGTPIYAELVTVRTIKAVTFLPQLILGFVLAISPFISLFFKQKDSYFELYAITFVTLFITLIVFSIVAVLMDRMKVSVISGDSALNQNYARAKKKVWKDIWVVLSWIMIALMIALVIIVRLPYTNGLFISYILAATLIPLIPFFVVMSKLNKIEKAYNGSIDVKFDADDDKYWIWGQFYYNPHDSRAMIEKRYGTGATMNMGSKSGKVITVMCALILFSIPLSAVWMIITEKTPMHVEIKDDMLVTYQLTTKYKVPVDSVRDVTVIEGAPKAYKISGTGLDTFQSGLWNTKEYGKVRMYMNPKNNKFLMFSDGEYTYIVSGYNDEETVATADLLAGR